MSKTSARVLEILEANRGRCVSGAKIAEELGVSRSAVWKAVADLREGGYKIVAATNNGYMLDKENDIITVQSILPYMRTEHIGKKLTVLKETTSTNDEAKKLVREAAAEDGIVIVADTQTAGRGRMERSFYSPEGTGVYMSILLKPQLPLEKTLFITTCAAVAAARAIDTLCREKSGGTAPSAEIKWVNDVYMCGKKVCGILTEASVDCESGGLYCAIVGIGINVLTEDFPLNIADKAGSVFTETGIRISRSRLVAEILYEFEREYASIENEPSFLSEYRSRSCVLGRKITVFRGNERYPAEAVEIDDSCRLVVKTEDGERRTVSSGEVSITIG